MVTANKNSFHMFVNCQIDTTTNPVLVETYHSFLLSHTGHLTAPFSCGNPALIQFSASMNLKRCRRIISMHTASKNCFGICSSTACYCSIFDRNIRILLLKKFNQCFYTVLFPSSGPPAKDFKLFGSILIVPTTIACT